MDVVDSLNDKLICFSTAMRYRVDANISECKASLRYRLLRSESISNNSSWPKFFVYVIRFSYRNYSKNFKTRAACALPYGSVWPHSLSGGERCLYKLQPNM